MNNILFFDLEIDEKTEKIQDIGAVLNNETFHSSSVKIFEFLPGMPVLSVVIILLIMI